MKRHILIAAALASTLAAIASGGKLVAADREVNLGVIRPDTLASGKLVLHNLGTEAVSITSIFTDCGCTATDYSRNPVAPGDSTVVDVTFDPTGRVPGEFRKAIRIRSTGSGGSTVAFVVGTIKRPLRK